jgi:outer membrane protein assembly factor BamD (BamD/ComL family)
MDWIRVAVLAAAVMGSTAYAQTSPPPSAPAPTSQPAPIRGYEFRGDRWVPVEQAAPTTVPVDEALDRAEDYLQRGGWSAARTILLRWFDTHDRKAPLRDRATFLFAEAYFQKGDRVLAFYHFDEVMDLYPESRLYPAAMQRQYDIADAYLNGYKDRFLYMAIIGREEEAIDMLFRIQSRAPGSALAEKALLRTADYYYETTQYDLAADAYAVFLKNYPRDPLYPQVKLRQAFATIAQFNGTRFDATPIIDGRQLLSELIVTDPELAKGQNLEELRKRIDEALAKKLYQQADWFVRTHHSRGAVYMCRLLIGTYPDSPSAVLARQMLDGIPDGLKADPDPTSRPAPVSPDLFTPPTSGPAPSSAPSSSPAKQ